MLITKLHLGVALFASAYLYYSNQPLVQQRTTFLFPKFNKNTITKVWMTEKKSMLILHTMPSSKRKRDGINFHLRRIKLAYRKKNPKYSCIKVWLNGPIVVNGKKFNNAMSAMGLSNQEVADVMNYIMNSWAIK
jgi:hypothetical protein